MAAVRGGEESYSRNIDAHDVPLDGPAVDGVAGRLLARADAVAGGRGRDYLAERLKVVKDRWNEAKTGPTRLGYAKGKFQGQQLAPLLERAGEARWDDLTVGNSMRETENEINLLLPGGEIFHPLYGAPAWSFGAPTTEPDDATVGDEFGESRLDGGSG